MMIEGEKSAKRLELVQHVLSTRCVTDQDNDPCLLVIPGIDGRYNINSQRLMKYLFLGSTGEVLMEPEIAEELEALEGCFLCILTDGVKIFYGPNAQKLIGPIIAKWPNLEEFRLLPGDFRGDAEKRERFKIRSLIDMVKDHKTVVLPTSSVKENNHEQWPLVQAHGLDEFQAGGFLSAMHDIVHLGEDLNLLWSHIDDLAFAEHESAKLLLKHWNTSVRLISRQLREKGELDLDNDETSPFEPVQSFYDFGTIRQCQYVKKDLDSSSSSNERGASVKFSDDLCTFCVRAEDPESTLRLSRVYFLDGDKSLDLIRLYGALVTAYKMIICKAGDMHDGSHFSYIRDPSRSRAIRRLKAFAYDALVQVISTCEEKPLFDESCLSLKLETFDWAGQKVTENFITKENGQIPLNAFHYMELSLQVDDLSFPLVIGDSFIVDGGAVKSLTGSANSFLSWNTESIGDIASLSSLSPRSGGEHLGEALKGRRRTPCTMYFGRNLYRAETLVLEGHIQLYQNGLVFEHNALGQYCFDFTDKEQCNASLFQPTNHTILALEVGADLNPLLSAFHCDLVSHVAFVVKERTELSDAVHYWKENVDNLHFLDMNGKISVARCFTGSFIYQNLGGNENQEMAEEKEEEQKQQMDTSSPHVYVICGTPGSGKVAVANAFAKHFNCTLLATDPLIHGVNFEVSRLRKQIGKLSGKQRENIVVLLPGDTSPEFVFEGLADLDSYAVSVTAVVSAQNAYRDERKTNLLPGLQAQCAPGIVHTIAISAAGLVNEQDVDDLLDRLRHWNPNADIHRLPSCVPDNIIVSIEPEFWAHQGRVIAQKRTQVPSSHPIALHHQRHNLESRVVYSSNVLLKRNRLELALQRLTKIGGSKKSPATTTKVSPGRVDIDLENLGGNAGNAKMGLRKAQEIAKQKLQEKKIDEQDLADIEQLALPAGEIFSVSGFVTFTSNETKKFMVSAANGIVRFSEYDDSNSKNRKKTVGLVFEGIHLDTCEAFQDFVGELQPMLPASLDFLTPEKVSERQKKLINKSLASEEELPSGYWFDGRSYMDYTGIPRQFHPKFMEKLGQWIETQNSSIKTHNENVKKMERERKQLQLSSF